MGFVELIGDRNDVGVSERVRDDAFMVAVQLKKCPDFDLYADDHVYRHRRFVAGAVAIYDLRTNLIYDLRPQKSKKADESFHAVDFYLPRRALDALTQDSGSSRIDELRHQPGGVIQDSVIGSLLRSVRPTLSARPQERNALFVDHVAMALATHLACTYGGMRLPPISAVGRLAPWQERRAKEMLASNLDGGVALSELAGACDLSIRHFTRAFRGSTGMSPHAWLRHQRVEKAKGLLTNKNFVIADIALDCGFADQSHFTRVFQRAAGMSPGAWRRTYRR
jgi:AraC-like DNA-binding protein